MNRCFELAKLGAGYVSPNPMVGAVLVHEGRVIGEGYHQQYGGPHAEVNCLSSVIEQDQYLIQTSTLYVSLEPCSHFGKTPPCVDLILNHKIPMVVVACKDISAKVNGKGIEKLRDAGVEVIEQILEDAAIELNKRFFTFHQKNRPYIVLKWAESVEGYIGSHSERIKLSNKETDKMVHQWRAEEDAIWVGYNTVMIDNPKLNVRLVEGNNPIRIVYDKDASLPSSLHLFDQLQSTIIFNHQISKQDQHVEWIQIEAEQALTQMLNHLAKKNSMSVLVEGGTSLLQQFIKFNLYDEIRCIKTSTSLCEGVKAPEFDRSACQQSYSIGSDTVFVFRNTA